MRKIRIAAAALAVLLLILTAAIPASAAASQEGGSIPRITDIAPVQNGVKISFSAYQGAAYYRVFIKKSDGSGWKGIADTTALTYTRTGVTPYSTDVYTVRALDWSGRFCSSFDPNGFTYTYLPAPKLKSAESVYGGVKITWDAVRGAAGYRVYVKTGSDWKGLGNTTSTSFTAANVASGSSYTYTVRAFDADRNKVLSYYDRTGVTAKYVAAPEITAFVPIEGGVRVTWDAVKGGVNYRLFYQKPDGSGWKAIGTTSSTSMNVTNLTDEKEYIYTVRVTDSKGAFISGYNAAGWTDRYLAPPQIAAVTPMSGDLHLYWAPSKYAAGYRVYRREYGGTWRSLGQVKRTSFTDMRVIPGVLYSYTLRSVDEDDRLNSYFEANDIYYCSGVPANGTFTVNGNTVKFVDGRPQQGFVTLGGKMYYYDKNGVLQKNGVVGSEKEGYRYAGPDGVIDTTFTGIAGSGKNAWYLVNGKVDTTARIAYSYGGRLWNVLDGKAREVVTEEDKVLYRALKLVAQVTTPSMTKEQKLRAMWNYCRDAYVEKNPRIPHYHGDDWPIIYANDMLINGVGNCISYGAEFCYIAKAIGYKDCYACHSGGHGWAEIDGLIYDIEWSRHVFTYNYYALSYDTKVDQNYRGAISAGLPWMHVRVCADYD